MAASTCWRCFSRLSLQPALCPPIALRPVASPSLLPAVAQPFSATAIISAQTQPANQRGRSNLRLKKKRRVKTYKQPASGERKALRKRIVLSNTNALEVQDLPFFEHEQVADGSRVAQIMALRPETVDGLRAAEAFKPSQNWAFFRQPCTLVREQTIEMGRLLREAGEKKEAVRRIIVGDRGVGKSILLLQAQAWALSKGWVVIHVPEAREITNATTAYAPLPKSDPLQYTQRDYTRLFLSRIAKTNKPVLSTLRLLQRHAALPAHFANVNSLQRLCELGASDPDNAWVAFQALWSELMAQVPADSQSRARPPVLMTLDGVAWVSRLSNYLTPSMHYIHAHDLALVRHFFDYLSGGHKLQNGGAVIAADSHSNRPHTPALDLGIRQSEERQAALKELKDGAELPEQPLFDSNAPWDRVDERGLVAIRGVPTMRLTGLSKHETRSQLEYFAKSGMLRRRVTETLVSEAWTLSGGGNMAQLERTSVGSGFM